MAYRMQKTFASRLEGTFIQKYLATDSLRDVTVHVDEGAVTAIHVRDPLLFGPARDIIIAPKGITIQNRGKKTWLVTVDLDRHPVFKELLREYGEERLAREAHNPNPEFLKMANGALRQVASAIRRNPGKHPIIVPRNQQ